MKKKKLPDQMNETFLHAQFQTRTRSDIFHSDLDRTYFYKLA